MIEQKNKILLIYNIGLLGAVLYLFGFFAQGISGPKYLGLYLTIGSALFLFFSDKFQVKERLENLYRREKVLFLILAALLSEIFLSALMSECGPTDMLSGFRSEFLNVGLFFLSMLVFIGNRKIATLLFFSIVAAGAYDVLYYAFDYYKNNPTFNLSKFWGREFSFIFELTFPYLLALLFLDARYKFIAFLLIALGLVLDVLTGARGGWLSIFASSLLFVWFVFYYKKSYRKMIFKTVSAFMIVVTIFFAYSYTHGGYIKKKLDAGLLNTTGRDVIVKSRFPIFWEHGNIFIGVGGPSNKCYNEYLHRHNAPKRAGKKIGQDFHYYSDEPFFLNVFYKEGIVGLILFVWLLGILFYKYIKLIKKIVDDNLLFYFSVASFVTFFSYFFIRSFLEIRNFKLMLIFSIIYLTIKYSSSAKDTIRA